MIEDNDESSQAGVPSEDDADAAGLDIEKIAVDCICPKCGIRHVMHFPWTGRGVPRKFCPQCRKSV